MGYRVTISVDSLDPNPSIHEFDNGDEATDFLYTHVNESVQYRVDHSPYSISEEERESMVEEEMALIRLEKI